jgi:hypothetical protein
LFVALPLAAANSENPQTAVEEGREALDRWWGYPWYDSATDSLRRIEIQPPRPPSNFDWQALFEVIRVLGWVVLAGVLALLAWLLIRAYLERERRAAQAAAREHRRRGLSEVDRVTALPFQVKRPESDLLAEARRHYERGDYGEAIVYFYSYQLVELDKAQMIRLARGKTNRQYVREARAASGVGELLRQTMTLFEEAFFGHHAIDKTQFEACWNRLAEFEEQLAPAPA